MAAPSLEKWIDDLQAHGKYSFLRREALSGSGLSSEAVKKALQRIAARGHVAKAKDYFFVIVPLEYSNSGAPPASWFIHDLMAAMERAYYVGLLSAAGLHGASHQQPQEFQVITDRPIRPITIGRTKIRFFVSKFVDNAATMNVKTPTGAMRVSTPETTVVDLVRFSKVAGQLDNVATVISEMAPTLDSKKLIAAVRAIHDVPNAQRLGYILDMVHARSLAKSLNGWVERQSAGPVPLRPSRSRRAGKEDRRWHVLVDEPLEIES